MSKQKIIMGPDSKRIEESYDGWPFENMSSDRVDFPIDCPEGYYLVKSYQKRKKNFILGHGENPYYFVSQHCAKNPRR